MNTGGKPREWFGEYLFNEDYLRLYEPQLNEERNTRECDLIEELLDLDEDHKILDLACGQGRHAIELSRRGYTIVGYDYSTYLLGVAEKRAKEAGVEVEFVQGDMRELPYDNEFDRIYNFFTSFGYFSEEENEEATGLIARALKEGGWFLMDMISRDWIVKNFREKDWNNEGDIYFFNERYLNLENSRAYNKRHIIEDGDVNIVEFDHRLYSLHELIRLFEDKGLKIKEVCGSPVERVPFTLKSSRMVIVTEKI